jgi:hypothetical protein
VPYKTVSPCPALAFPFTHFLAGPALSRAKYIRSMDSAQHLFPPYHPQPTSGSLQSRASSLALPWHQPSSNNPPSASSSHIFMTTSPLPDYTSSPSSPFTDFHAGHQSPSIQTNHAPSPFPTDLSPQVESTSGPTRGALTRRRARLAQVNQPDFSRRGTRQAEV